MKSTYREKTEVDDRKLKQTCQTPISRLQDRIYHLAPAYVKKSNMFGNVILCHHAHVFADSRFPTHTSNNGVGMSHSNVQGPTVPNVSRVPCTLARHPAYFGPHYWTLAYLRVVVGNDGRNIVHTGTSDFAFNTNVPAARNRVDADAKFPGKHLVS